MANITINDETIILIIGISIKIVKFNILDNSLFNILSIQIKRSMRLKFMDSIEYQTMNRFQIWCNKRR